MDPAVIISVAAALGIPISVYSAVLAYRAVEASRASARDSKRSADAAVSSAAAAKEQLRLATAPRFRARLERVPKLSGFGQRLWLTLVSGSAALSSAVVEIAGGSTLLPGQGGREEGMLFDPVAASITVGPLTVGEPIALTVYAGEHVPIDVGLRVTTTHEGHVTVALIPVEVPRFEPDDYRTLYDD